MFIFRLIRKFIVIVVVFILGAAAGGYIVTRVKPRSFLNIKECSVSCIEPKEFLGLLGSIGLQYAPELIPGKVLETDKTVVIKQEDKTMPIHYVIIPKKDIKNIGELEEGDQDYIQDAVAVMGELIRRDNLVNYRITSNGPGYQTVAYLHFHLTSK